MLNKQQMKVICRVEIYIYMCVSENVINYASQIRFCKQIFPIVGFWTIAWKCISRLQVLICPVKWR